MATWTSLKNTFFRGDGRAAELTLPENSPKFVERGFVFLLPIAELRLYFYKLSSLSSKISGMNRGRELENAGGCWGISVSLINQIRSIWPAALAALPRSDQKEDGRKRFEQGVKTIGGQSIDIFHTLQFSIKGSKMQGIISAE